MREGLADNPVSEADPARVMDSRAAQAEATKDMGTGPKEASVECRARASAQEVLAEGAFRDMEALAEAARDLDIQAPAGAARVEVDLGITSQI
jgi:hypothetical protein